MKRNMYIVIVLGIMLVVLGIVGTIVTYVKYSYQENDDVLIEESDISMLLNTINEQQVLIDELERRIDELSHTNDILAEHERIIDYLINRVAVLEETENVVAEENLYFPSKLTASGGVCFYNGHKETYYNLPMTAVVNIAHANGIEGEYWVNSDGCKMLGDYIIVAADQSIHPYGSLVETSLGTGIVLDTGSFIFTNSEQLDLATNW